MKPKINLAGEVELEKGGPGSGRRQGDGGKLHNGSQIRIHQGLIHPTKGAIRYIVGNPKSGIVDFKDSNGNITHSGVPTGALHPDSIESLNYYKV